MSSNVIPEGWTNGAHAHPISHDMTHNQTVPIDSIPPEIIGKFFGWGKRFSMDARYDPTNQASSYNFELAVSHVNRRLRDVAIGTSLLWTDIDLSLLKSADALATYLKRSKSLPLDIRLGAHGSVALGKLLDILIPQIHRWRSLSVGSQCKGHVGALFIRLRDMQAPSLEHFSIYASGQGHLNGFSPEVLIDGAPALSFVRLGNNALSSLCPPLTSIVTLHIDQTSSEWQAGGMPPFGIDYDQLRQVLIASPSLANLSISGDVITQAMWPPANPENEIPMPALRSLRIRGITGSVYCGILLNISAPGLKSLTLKGVFDRDLEQLSDSPQMTPPRHKFPALRSLTVCDFQCTGAAYLQLSTAFPEITQFTSLHSPISKWLITFLGGGGTQSPHPSLLDGRLPWPNLKTVALSPLRCLDLNRIVAMIKNRKRLGHPIDKLRLGAASGDITLQKLDNQRLGEGVTVEGFSDVDPWPVELRYSDYDDLF
jgi:hypothetical protein